MQLSNTTKTITVTKKKTEIGDKLYKSATSYFPGKYVRENVQSVSVFLQIEKFKF